MNYDDYQSYQTHEEYLADDYHSREDTYMDVTSPQDEYDYIILYHNFSDEEEAELQDLLKHEPRGW